VYSFTFCHRPATRSFTCIATAVRSLFTCAPLLLARRPQTPLRVLCIGTFEYLARLHGPGLHYQCRNALAYACDFAALRNDFYDQRELQRDRYRELRHGLRQLVAEPQTRLYIQNLRRAERGRPAFGPDGFSQPTAVAEYRVLVLSLTLRWLQTISGRPLEPRVFEALVALADLVQIVDDLLDWKDDWACRRPSYVTAFLNERTPPSRQSTMHIRRYANQCRHLLTAARTRDPQAAPLAMAGLLVWCLAIALLNLRFPR
jgi:hypothetical protein